MAKNDTPKGVKCSFCGKTQDSVRKIQYMLLNSIQFSI